MQVKRSMSPEVGLLIGVHDSYDNSNLLSESQDSITFFERIVHNFLNIMITVALMNGDDVVLHCYRSK